MKPSIKFHKAINLMLFIVLISVVTSSCKNKKENNKTYAGSSQREDICQLLTQENVQTVFALANNTEIEQRESGNAICSYGWQAKSDNYIYYKVSLNFARGGQRNNSGIDAIWESQNKQLYHKHNMQEVSGVGDKASWSKLGGGQLRVASNGYIFYVSISATTTGKTKNPLSEQDMIEKASDLANHVIKKM